MFPKALGLEGNTVLTHAMNCINIQPQEHTDVYFCVLDIGGYWVEKETEINQSTEYKCGECCLNQVGLL